MAEPYKYVSLAMRWRGLPGFDQDLSQALTLIRYLADGLFAKYDPDRKSNFLDRFDSWLENATGDDEKRELVRLIRYILFFGREELMALSRSAFNVNISRWLVDQIGQPFFNDKIVSELNRGVATTWFCSVTDMNISSFYHVNNISGELRPDWGTLVGLGSSDAIHNYIEHKDVRRIVLLEDFIGSGRQMALIVQAARKMIPETIPVLLCPLIICPKGDAVAKRLALNLPSFSYSPVMVLPERRFIKKKPEYGEYEYFGRLRDLLNKYAENVQENPSAAGTRWGKNPFGYQGSGALVVLHTNCPNNTIRIIHHAKNWSPLFSRNER